MQLIKISIRKSPMKFIVLFLCSMLYFPYSSFAQPSGKYHCAFAVIGQSNRMTIDIRSGVVKHEIDLTLPDNEELKPVRMDRVIVNDTSLTFTWTAYAITFKGKHYVSGDSISGEMTQSSLKWPVTFLRDLPERIELKRPQQPIEPFEFISEDHLVSNGKITLGATLTLPKGYDFRKYKGGEQIPLVILASGSGAQDRNCEIMAHQPFLVIADHLAKNGIACVRFDDRGVGKSTGVFQLATLDDFASDVNAIVNHLAKDARFKTSPIGVAGHSEGGMHALIAASKNKKIKFVIELASVGTTGRDVLVEQQYLIPLKSGLSEEMAVWNRSVYAGISDLLIRTPAKNRSEVLGTLLDSIYATALPEYKTETSFAQFKMGMMLFANNEWLSQFVRYDASTYLKKLKIPLLAINGGEDIQVPAQSNHAGFENHFSVASKQAGSKAIVIEGLNHLFQTCKKCDIMEYGDLEETFSPLVLDEMVKWIQGNIQN
jgi:pimeloyl-ACP methyl ester carboxylesterase